ncbi:hypothetical protein CEXT_106881 [Caerostris extrusa]|uniref:Uncharacterized protein n=1 Tax=Caerostris extrusa TaxID=172846 RepID=A0AAV4XDA8_CAEEX|nr:hypothetical protein CEXT_106881 [Caerostris extrusa]
MEYQFSPLFTPLRPDGQLVSALAFGASGSSEAPSPASGMEQKNDHLKSKTGILNSSQRRTTALHQNCQLQNTLSKDPPHPLPLVQKKGVALAAWIPGAGFSRGGGVAMTSSTGHNMRCWRWVDIRLKGFCLAEFRSIPLLLAWGANQSNTQFGQLSYLNERYGIAKAVKPFFTEIRIVHHLSLKSFCT